MLLRYNERVYYMTVQCEHLMLEKGKHLLLFNKCINFNSNAGCPRCKAKDICIEIQEYRSLETLNIIVAVELANV